jgi:hypothetical protein
VDKLKRDLYLNALYAALCYWLGTLPPVCYKLQMLPAVYLVQDIGAKWV